ncbi:hypothetical protein GQ44DRAFT_778304 [Phaeosphaeriaceae sp. PMI808]|nr:hypothetical protein GQ44DRAFT_778304 [Phaeosphaeriaceae sp. PMI808]
MQKKRTHSEGDDRADGSRLKRQARHKHFVSYRLSSPPLESNSPCDSPSKFTPQLHSSQPLPVGTVTQREHDKQSEQSTPPLPLPLTQENLRQLRQRLRKEDSPMPSSLSRRSRSPEKSSLTDRMDPKDKLQLFNIFYDERAPIPSILEQHVSGLRKPREAPSPNAKRL